MKIRQEKIFGAGITLVILSIIIIAVFSFYQTRTVNDITSRIAYTRNVLLQLSDLHNTTIEHAGAARNYSLTGSSEDIQKMQTTAADLHSKLEELRGQIKKDFAVRIEIDSIEKYINKRVDYSNQLISIGKEKGLAAATALYQTGTGRDYNNIIFSFVQQLQSDELSTLQLNEEENTGNISKLNLYLLGLLGFVLILIIILVQKSRLDMMLRRRTEDHLKNFNLQLQKQVKEKTAELTGVFERITDGFIALDKDYRFTYVNKKAGELTGRAPDSFIGKNLWKEFDHNISPVFRNAVLKAMESQEYVHFEEFSPAYNLWFEDHLYPSPEGLSIFYRDISERKKAWQENERIRYLLNERIKELTTLYRAGQILQAKDETIDSVLQQLVSILVQGWQYPEIAAARIALGSKEFLTPNFADGPHKQNVKFELANGDACIVEVIYLEDKPEETEGPFLAEERNLINLVAEMLRTYFTRKTASELLLAEKNLSDSVINSLPGVFYFFDITGKFIRWNKRFETVTGYCGDEISQMHPLEFFEGSDKEYIQSRIEEVFKTGASDAEALFVSKDKTKTPYYFTGVSIDLNGLPYLLGTGIDITERKKAEEELLVSKDHLKQSYEDIRRLASNIENIREGEKIKIAREIHDELGQQLTGLKMDISWVGKKIDPKDAILHKKLKEILHLLDETVKSVRRIASELRPGLLDDLGLIAAIEWQSQEFEKRSGIKVAFSSTGSDNAILPHVSTGLFRIFQESLTNIARHAKAKKITAMLYLHEDKGILQIHDDGIGFDATEVANKKTLGLLGMKERTMMMGGQYEISSEPGRGTTVLVTVPLAKDSNPKISSPTLTNT